MKPEKVTCLVVDDEEILRSALIRIVERAGHRCLQADSGITAIEVLENEKDEVPLIITDIQMPGMDGIELLKVVLERWPQTAVLVLTAVTEVEIAVKTLRYGAFDYLTKPFQIEEIDARIQQVLEKRNLIVENRKYQNHLAELVQEQADRLEELYLEGIQSLVFALEAKDTYTHGHSARVAAYSVGMAASLGLTEDDVQLLRLGADLHDVGKIGIREDVLLKPGKLTADEYDHICEHVVIGERILRPILKTAPGALQIVRSHHERFDGKGFPDGKAGEEVPFLARIVTVADTFDAMTTARPYRPARSVSGAVDELAHCKGGQFDPTVVEAFFSAYNDVASLPMATPFPSNVPLPAGVATGSKTPPVV